ncbi:MAG: GNAT family N-acetyltransferase [Gelidibacter sp.]
MIKIKRTDSTNSGFIGLVQLLDADLKIRDGVEHDFYHQFNAIVDIKNCIVLYEDETPIGCGAIKLYDEKTIEIKRMYVLPEHRGKGIAVRILFELEIWAQELGFSKCILETGFKQPEAIALYKKAGFKIIPNYGQYIGVENSVCFGKKLVRD